MELKTCVNIIVQAAEPLKDSLISTFWANFRALWLWNSEQTRSATRSVSTDQWTFEGFGSLRNNIDARCGLQSCRTRVKRLNSLLFVIFWVELPVGVPEVEDSLKNGAQKHVFVAFYVAVHLHKKQVNGLQYLVVPIATEICLHQHS